MRRRKFILNSGLGTIAMMVGKFPLHAFNTDPDITKLTILHTNDVHSRIDPFPMDGSRNEGMGGAARRMAMLNDLRMKEKNTILLDAGDILQGTPYFNYFGGELEFKLMNEMQYDAATIGNHDFDGGMETLAGLVSSANFSMLTANYDFSDTLLSGKTKPYKILIRDGIKVGVFGMGIELDGLVPEKLIGKTRYLDPVKTANKYASILKHEEKCDLVICLSHMGYKYKKEPSKISDVKIAAMTRDVDIIIGGHTHTFMRKPDAIKNLDDREVLVTQAGFAGIMLGRLEVYFEKNKKGHCTTCKNTFVG
jgi:5'-nucleotidase